MDLCYSGHIEGIVLETLNLLCLVEYFSFLVVLILTFFGGLNKICVGSPSADPREYPFSIWGYIMIIDL